VPQLIWLKVPNKTELYYLSLTINEHKAFDAVFRALNGHDLEYLESKNFDLSSSAAAYDLVKRLEVSASTDLLDLELEYFALILKRVYKELIEKQLLTTETWLECVFIAGGKRFEPDFSAWLNVPLPILAGMVNIAKKYLSTF
jgi:hypothetical protein